MLTIYTLKEGKIQVLENPQSCPDEAVWIDLFAPTETEEHLIEARYGIDIPTREEIKGIEFSNRFYEENGFLFMTATAVAGSDSEQPSAIPVTFILGEVLMTLRYHDPRSFAVFRAKNDKRLFAIEDCPAEMLVGLVETIIDKLTDPLENSAAEIEALSQRIFHINGKKPKNFNKILKDIGRHGDLNSKLKESLVSFDRLLTFLSFKTKVPGHLTGTEENMESIRQDIRSLTEFANFMSNKITFLLDATLGMVNIEQNSIIKFFSVAAVIFMPPTLVGTVYGMNFQHMPELHSMYGYPLALAAMVMSAILPYLYFKHKKWL